MIIKCKVPIKHIANGILWLGAEKADGGFYLYQYEDPSLPCKWDTFYQTLEDLATDCQDSFGIDGSTWDKLKAL